MNIKEAKEEVMHTVRAYLAKDETGSYMIPVEKQRPMLLMGPPGIGKTAIMEQIAQEMGINLVSYTITHHTRQSAIGLPMIAKKTFGEKEYATTEYTMSEIIASIYEQIEASGVKEGILFLDEINCVSETLAPTMLQFLQYKTFGSHQVPEGFVIVTAGNPPEYNKSVRDFDIVTLDRVKRMDITEDVTVWKEYAYKAGVHGAILAYLSIKPQNFYTIHTQVEGRRFVTARGWEDLSAMMLAYESLEIPVTEQIVGEYIQDPEIARDFAVYYELYDKYCQQYRIPELLEGHYPENTNELADAPFDEKLSLIGLLIDGLTTEFKAYGRNHDVQGILFTQLKSLRQELAMDANVPAARVRDIMEEEIAFLEKRLKHETEAKMLTSEEIRCRRMAIDAMKKESQALALSDAKEATAAFAEVKAWFAGREKERQEQIAKTRDHLTHAFGYMAGTYGENQEMVIFLSELSAGYDSLRFIRECGCDAYYKYNKMLLLQDQQDVLRDQIAQAMQL